MKTNEEILEAAIYALRELVAEYNEAKIQDTGGIILARQVLVMIRDKKRGTGWVKIS